MLTYEQALEKAKAFLATIETSPGVVLEIIEPSVEDHGFGWIFPYNTAEYLRTGTLQSALVGTQPLLVDKRNGNVMQTTSAGRDKWLAYYERHGEVPPPGHAWRDTV